MQTKNCATRFLSFTIGEVHDQRVSKDAIRMNLLVLSGEMPSRDPFIVLIFTYWILLFKKLWNSSRLSIIISIIDLPENGKPIILQMNCESFMSLQKKIWKALVISCVGCVTQFSVEREKIYVWRTKCSFWRSILNTFFRSCASNCNCSYF